MAVILGLNAFHGDSSACLVRDVVELLAAYFAELLAARAELLVDLDGFLGQLLMRVLRAADQREVLARAVARVDVDDSVEAALRRIAALAYELPPRILITGSLYLAGQVLRINGTLPG